MKKHILAVVLFTFIIGPVIGQVKSQDVVYLKNGSIIRGIIVEQVPNKSLKIETSDRSIFVYQIDEIEKIITENTLKSSNKPRVKRGFIGVSAAASIPVGSFSETSTGYTKIGLQLNLINFGYLFSDNIGISVRWFGAANRPGKTEELWSYGGVMTGPLLSIQRSEKMQTDFKPMIGYLYAKAPSIDWDGYPIPAVPEAYSLAYSIGLQSRFHLNNTISFVTMVDYFFSKPKFSYLGIQKMQTLSPGLGIAFRI